MVMVIYYINIDLGGTCISNSNTCILIFKVIVIYYIDLGSISNSNILIFKVIVIVIYYIDLGSISNSNIFIFKGNYTDF